MFKVTTVVFLLKTNTMQRDQPIFDLIQKEQSRQLRGIELIASENLLHLQ